MKIKLGELQIMPKEWGRRSISIDHVRCLENDLVNGDTFPAMKVERTTKMIIGGNHRYKAYINFYGDGWRNKEVDIEFIDLPDCQNDPVAWRDAMIKDNPHNTERLNYSDRNKICADVLDYTRDPEDPKVLEIARKLHFTDASFVQFATTYLEQVKKKQMESGQTESEKKPKQYKPKTTFKAAHDDITPGEIRAMETAGTRARVLSKTNALLAELRGYAPGSGLVPREKELFSHLVVELQRLLTEIA
jgi:hypothetical protein